LAGAAGNELLHCGNQCAYPDTVGVTQWAAAEWGEPCAHDHGEINLARFRDHLFFETTRGFVDHQEDHPLLELGSRQRAGSLTSNEGKSLLVGLRRFPFAVQIKPTFGLASQ
jgi:hypothetical protein